VRKKPITKIPLWAYVPDRLVRAGRVAAYVATVALILVGALVWHARAQLGEQLLDAGTAMLAYEGAHRQDSRRTLLFNGQEIHFSSGMTRHGLGRVLDFYEAHCLAHDGGVAEDVDAFVDAHPEVRIERSVLEPILRSERGDRGTVACLYTNESGGTAGLVERFRRYRESGDVSAIGDMRYLYAEEGENGTHFVIMWTDGPFVLRDMLPEDRDAPGRDVGDLGRPEGVRRFASIREIGAPQAMTVYVARRDDLEVEDLEGFYRRDLEERGFRLFGTDAHRTLSAEKGQRMLTLIFDTNDDDRAAVTVLEAR
jgi:hypothetical protein